MSESKKHVWIIEYKDNDEEYVSLGYNFKTRAKARWYLKTFLSYIYENRSPRVVKYVEDEDQQKGISNE